MHTLDDFLRGITDPDVIREKTDLYHQYVANVTKVQRISSEIDCELARVGINTTFAELQECKGDVRGLRVLEPYFRSQVLPIAITRCFARPDAASDYWEEIRDTFVENRNRPDSDPFKQSLAVVLGEMAASREQLAELYEIIEDSRNGGVRSLMMDKVKRAGIPLFTELFERLVERDEDVRKEIASWTTYWKKRNPAIIERWGKSAKKRTQK